MTYRFKHIALGGTFDLLHKGHESLLLEAFKKGSFVSIGLSTDKFCLSLAKNPYQKQKIRRKQLILFLKKNKIDNRAKIISLHNIYGSVLEDKTIEALAVTKATKKNAHKINNERIKLGLNKLSIVLSKQIFAQTDKLLSSTDIRKGIINRSGRSYKNFLAGISGKRLNNKIRTRLKKPFGKISSRVKNQRLSKPIVTVGDVTTACFLKMGISPDIAVVDFYVNRKKEFRSLSDLGFSFKNPDIIITNRPGQISKTLINTIEKLMAKTSSPKVILVKGEEDLAAVPAILLSPLGTSVFYGQPNVGMIKVEVSETIKNRVSNIFK